MCVHHWHIDENDYGKCAVCGKEQDFKPGVNKALGCEHESVRKHFHFKRDMVATGGFYLQGAVRQYPIRNVDHCFSADWIE